jgi:hypothetical protein
VEGLGRGVVASAVAIGAGLVAWSLTGLRAWPAGRRPDPAVLGLTVLAVALLAEAVAQTGLLAAGPALGVVVGAWALGGLGIGIAYPQLSSRAFDGLTPWQVAPVATAVAFAETTALVIGSLLGAGVYSLGTGAGASDRLAIGTGFALAALIAVGAWLAVRRRSPGAATGH